MLRHLWQIPVTQFTMEATPTTKSYSTTLIDQHIKLNFLVWLYEISIYYLISTLTKMYTHTHTHTHTHTNTETKTTPLYNAIYLSIPSTRKKISKNLAQQYPNSILFFGMVLNIFSKRCNTNEWYYMSYMSGVYSSTITDLRLPEDKTQS